MTFTTTPTRVAATDFCWSVDAGVAATVRRVIAAAAAQDGVDPLDEATLLALRHGLGSSSLWVAGEEGFAWRHDRTLDLVVAPGSRGRRLGSSLAEVAAAAPGRLTGWSHGDHPAAAALAARLGFDRVRELWLMRRPLSSLPPLPTAPAGGVDVRTFGVGEDEATFLALNAEAFAHHPEQAGLTRAGLDERMAEPWFDPAGFFLAFRADRPVGFHWTKVHADATPAFGEVYVLGVSPTAQGEGLATRLTLVGLHHLAGLHPTTGRLDEVVLYVESDNAPAVALYDRLGFTHEAADTHVQYARPGGR